MAVCAHVWTKTGLGTALIDVVEMNDRHTAAYIRQVITGVLESYGRSIDDFFRITTDSGANFISAFKYGSCATHSLIGADPVERVFSKMTAYHSGHKGAIASDTLRSKMMVSFNKHLL